MTRSHELCELFSCGLHGHVLVGVGAAEVTAFDHPFVREYSGARWHRCLRCDAWVPAPLPRGPAMATVPARPELTLPLRGPALRDRFVLRLIAVERFVHVVVLAGVAVALFVFVGHRASLESAYDHIMNDLIGSSGGPSALRGVLGSLHRLFLFNPRHLAELGVAATAYAALEATEMVGLWLAKRWAEYLTFVATALLLPLEIYELTIKVSTFKIVVFALNLAVALYLLLAKRLFGARGGYRAEHERRQEESGWPAFDAATPPFPDAPRDERQVSAAGAGLAGTAEAAR